MSDESLAFLEKWHFKIAGVMVNPMMHFTGVNQVSPPGEKVTLGKRDRTAVSREDYAAWLTKLGDKCRYCTKFLTPIAFMLDDVYFAFRHHEGFTSASYFKTAAGKPQQPDVVILGKGVAGGMPLSVVVGNKRFMQKGDTNYLLKLNRTVGTLSAYPIGVIASNVFLSKLLGKDRWFDPVKELKTANTKFDKFTKDVNAEFEKHKLPLRLRNFANTFSLNFLNNSLYNSMFCQYLISNEVFLSNQSTGKFNMACDYPERDLEELKGKFVLSGQQMLTDGFFEEKVKLDKFTVAKRFIRSWFKLQYDQIMLDKEIDIEVSHNHPVNKLVHFWSSVGMILLAYPCISFGYLKQGFSWFLITHIVRQAGHFFYEHQDRDWEKQKFGHKDGSKKIAAAMILLAVITYHYCYNRCYEILSADGTWQEFLRDNSYFFKADTRVAKKILLHPEHSMSCWVNEIILFFLNYVTSEQFVTICALMTIFPHFLEIVFYYSPVRGVQWVIKIVTDPFTDVLDFYTHVVIHPKWFLDFRKQGKVVYKLDIFTKEIVEVKQEKLANDAAAKGA
jgi:hypothetical protein